MPNTEDNLEKIASAFTELCVVYKQNARLTVENEKLVEAIIFKDSVIKDYAKDINNLLALIKPLEDKNDELARNLKIVETKYNELISGNKKSIDVQSLVDSLTSKIQ